MEWQSFVPLFPFSAQSLGCAAFQKQVHTSALQVSPEKEEFNHERVYNIAVRVFNSTFLKRQFIQLGAPLRTNGIRPETGCLGNQ